MTDTGGDQSPQDSFPSTTDPLRIGIAGGGFIGRRVGGTFVDNPRASVVALADIDPDALQDTGDELGVPTDGRYDDYREMLDDADLDAVVIGTPHTLHYEQILAALEYDLHVLCDKPLTTDLDHARDLVQRDAARDEVLMVGYQRHLDPTFLEAREVWSDPARDPRWITASVCQRWVERFPDTWRQDPSLSGGGYLYDTGSHLLDAILWTTGLTPDAVSAQMDFIDDAQQVDGRANLTVRFTSGATASISLSGETPCMREHIRMWDDQGAVTIDGANWTAKDYTEITEDGGENRPNLTVRDQRSKADAFVDAVASGEEPPATALDGLRVTAVTEAAYESAQGDGSFVEVDPDDVALD